jgi:single-stranded-DNA-specific exonuclease
MNFKTNPNINKESLLDDIFKARGVEDIKTFLSPVKDSLYSPKLLKNIEKGYNMLLRHVDDSNILIIVDSDADGYNSATIIYSYLKTNFPNIKLDFTMHNGKQHGISFKTFDKTKYDLIIVPDAGTNDFKEHLELFNDGIDVLVLDHHEIETESEYACVINCQDGSYPNPNLSGGAVVYKFIKYLDEKLNINYADYYLDLVALSLISDSMDLRVPENRYLAFAGLDSVNNSFIKAIIKKQEFYIKQNTIVTWGWNIAPLINGTIRYGTQDEKIKMFRAFIEEEENFEYKKRKTKNNPFPETVIETLQDNMARVCVNVKSRQDNAKKKHVEELKKQNQTGNIKIFNAEKVPNELTGLIANVLASYYKTPALVVRENGNDEYSGSGRNCNGSPIDSLNDFLTASGFVQCQGHGNAHGVRFNKDKLEDLHAYIETNTKDLTFGESNTYSIDFEFTTKDLSERLIREFGSYDKHFGNGFEPFLFVIKGMTLPVKNVELTGEKLKSIHFTYNKIDFYKPYASQDKLEEFICLSKKGFAKMDYYINATVVCKFKIGYDNKPYVEIVDFKTEKESIDSLF